MRRRSKAGAKLGNDRDAVPLLFARHHLRVFRFLTRIVKNEEIAEDLLNEMFLDVWRGSGHRALQGAERVAAALVRVAR